jgi:P27 family predicted phage terminase small subunit
MKDDMIEFPSILHKSAKLNYKTLYEIVKEDLENGDEHLLAVLANTMVTYEAANKELNDRGPVMAGETMTRANPAFGIVKESEKIIESLASHFGLSPKSRKSSFKQKGDDEEDLLANFKSDYKGAAS